MAIAFLALGRHDGPMFQTPVASRAVAVLSFPPLGDVAIPCGRRWDEVSAGVARVLCWPELHGGAVSVAGVRLPAGAVVGAEPLVPGAVLRVGSATVGRSPWMFARPVLARKYAFAGAA
ncbi:MAG: hypothetical protein LBB58_00440, partial [Cellulomonadaceae bacterium]|nr:hypothetical protein [Cellulomonadaceae bacterium]